MEKFFHRSKNITTKNTKLIGDSKPIALDNLIILSENIAIKIKMIDKIIQ